MTIPEICKLIVSEIPTNFTELASHLASLDTKTAIEIISKYNEDMKMSQKQLSEEIQKQIIRRCSK